MELTEKAIRGLWGLGLVLPWILLYLVLVASQGPWVKWVAPLLFILPIMVCFIKFSGHSLATFNGIILGVFLYGLSVLLIAFVNVLRKPKKPRILGK